GTNLDTLQKYSQDGTGRALILDALVKSTMPDFIVDRLADPAFGRALSAGPVVPTDPHFIQNAHPAAGSFATTDWSGSGYTTSVANGWYVTSASANNGQGPLRFTSNVTYLTPSSISSTVGGVTTITPINVERWRAWLDGNNFLAQRAGII